MVIGILPVQNSDAAVQTPSFMMHTCAVCVCVTHCVHILDTNVCVHLSEWESARQIACPACLCDATMGLLGQETLIKLCPLKKCGNTLSSSRHFYNDEVCVLVCMCEEAEGRKLSSCSELECSSPVYPITDPPQIYFLKGQMTSSLSDLQQQLHDFMSYFDTGTKMAGRRREPPVAKTHQLFYKLRSFRPFHQRQLSVADTIQWSRNLTDCP